MGLKIETYKDVVLKDLLNDYRCTFHKHTCKLKTNYKKNYLSLKYFFS